jgi:hypothetical protein
MELNLQAAREDRKKKRKQERRRKRMTERQEAIQKRNKRESERNWHRAPREGTNKLGKGQFARLQRAGADEENCRSKGKREEGVREGGGWSEIRGLNARHITTCDVLCMRTKQQEHRDERRKEGATTELWPRVRSTPCCVVKDVGKAYLGWLAAADAR